MTSQKPFFVVLLKCLRNPQLTQPGGKSIKGIGMSFRQKNRFFFFVVTIYQPENFTLALPFHEKK